MADEETKEDLRAALEAYDEGWEWDEEDESFKFEGESADGQASWEIEASFCGGYGVKRECGWYEQHGEAPNLEEMVWLMEAMDAASKALNDYMTKKMRE